MLSLTSDYHIRMLEINSIRNTYIPIINNIIYNWNNKHIPWSEDTETAFEWVVSEYISKILRLKINHHYKSDLGEFIIRELPDLTLEIKSVIEPVFNFSFNNNAKRIKIMILGNILIIGILI